MDSVGSQSTPPSFRKKNPEARKVAAVSSKHEDGNISTAVRILCSDDIPTVFSSDILGNLKCKHPLEHNEICVSPSPNSVQTLQVFEDKMLDASR